MLALTAMLVLSPVAAAKSGATITGGLSDSCRDFQAHSSKDISHVEIHYATDIAVKDDNVGSPDYSLDGGPGDEIAFVIVKSSTTTERFECAGDDPPTAVLEIKTPQSCATASDGTVVCDWATPTGWTSSESVRFVCSGFESFPCTGTVTFRGTSSTDPDDDIVSWSIDFGDGTSTSGIWTSNPPAEVSHTYAIDGNYTVVLTVTDSTGQISSDSATVGIDTEGLD